MTFPHPHSKLGSKLRSNTSPLNSLPVSRVEPEDIFKELEPQELIEVDAGLLTQVNSCSPACVKSISLPCICLSRSGHFISWSSTEAAIPPDGLKIEACSKGICPFRPALSPEQKPAGMAIWLPLKFFFVPHEKRLKRNQFLRKWLRWLGEITSLALCSRRWEAANQLEEGEGLSQVGEGTGSELLPSAPGGSVKVGMQTPSQVTPVFFLFYLSNQKYRHKD